MQERNGRVRCLDMKRLPICLAVAATLAGAAPAQAIVGGKDAPAGKYTSVARVSFGIFSCTGTLISPDTVLTAGHCGSATGLVVGTPIGYPPQAFTVRIGEHRRGDSNGQQRAVASVHVSPEYLAVDGYDLTVLKLASDSTKAPTQVAGPSLRSIWEPGDLQTIAGWGVTEENGSAPNVLQEAQVPIVSDETCDATYSGFENRSQVCAGYPEGGIDTCQGDSGGPLFGVAGDGSFKVVGATSYGEGCARPGKYGVYARVADDALRTWVASLDPDGVTQ